MATIIYIYWPFSIIYQSTRSVPAKTAVDFHFLHNPHSTTVKVTSRGLFCYQIPLNTTTASYCVPQCLKYIVMLVFYGLPKFSQPHTTYTLAGELYMPFPIVDTLQVFHSYLYEKCSGSGNAVKSPQLSASPVRCHINCDGIGNICLTPSNPSTSRTVNSI